MQIPGTHPGFTSDLLRCGSESNEKMCQGRRKKTNQYLFFYLKSKNVLLLSSLPIFTFSGLKDGALIASQMHFQPSWGF